MNAGHPTNHSSGMLDLIPQPAAWSLNSPPRVKLSPPRQGGVEVDGSLVQGQCADCGKRGVRRVEDPPFVPHEPQDFPTPVSDR
jgi:hypothetical protein